MPKNAQGLTPKQERFVQEYLIDLNATQAAIRAGYSPKTAEVQGARVLTYAKIQAAIQAGMDKRAARTGITQDRVLQELARIAFFDLRRLYREDGSLKLPNEWDDEAAAALAGLDVVEMAGGMAVGGGGEEGGGGLRHVPMYTKKAKVSDKVSALTLAMRHLGMLNERVTLDLSEGALAVLFAAMPPEAAAALKASVAERIKKGKK